MNTPNHNTICLAIGLSLAAVCLCGARLTLLALRRKVGTVSPSGPSSAQQPTIPVPSRAIRRLMLQNILTKLNRL